MGMMLFRSGLRVTTLRGGTSGEAVTERDHHPEPSEIIFAARGGLEVVLSVSVRPSGLLSRHGETAKSN